MKKRTKSCIALVASTVFPLSAIAMFAFLLYCRQAAYTPPSSDAAHESTVGDGDRFPAIDWDYWQDINPDVIGWVTVPDTTVDSPILQAHGDALGHYLKRDVYGNYNPIDAIYLGADCEELGLSSRNATILGHHSQNDKKVAPMGTVADYKDVDSVRKHVRVLIRTPNTKVTYEVRFMQIVNGREHNKRIGFEGESGFCAWYGESRVNAAMVLDVEMEPEQVISLVTCPYDIWVDNERTVLVTSVWETAKNQTESTQTAPDAS